MLSGMLRSGNLTGATLKAAIRIRRVAEDSDDESGSESDEENSYNKGKDSKTPGNPEDEGNELEGF